MNSPKFYKEKETEVFENFQDYILCYSKENAKNCSNYMKLRQIYNKE